MKLSYQIYGKYKSVRNASWHCLLDHQVKTLPVSVLTLAKSMNIRVVKNSSVYELSPIERGLSVYQDDQWYVIYDDEDIVQKRRFTIAHEMGHILLGHDIKKYSKDDRAEMEADMFALRLLAPACVLWGLNLHSKEEIAAACSICNNAAYRRSERMKVLYRRNKFLEAPLERKLFDQFKAFISEQKCLSETT